MRSPVFLFGGAFVCARDAYFYLTLKQFSSNFI